MNRSLVSIIGLIIFLIVIVGAGILIYRFVVRDNSNASVIVISDSGKFSKSEYKLGNDDVFRIQNNSDKNQTIKKSSDKTTLVEVNANSSSRELSLPDNQVSELYLAGDESQKTKIQVGEVKEETDKEEPTKETSNQGSNEPVTPPARNLPDTGPENNLIFLALAGAGFVLYKLSKKIRG